MSTQISIISIASNGDQLTASGYTTEREVTRHLRDRLSYGSYYSFTIVRTTTASFRDAPVTTIETLTKAQAEARLIDDARA